MRNRRPQAVRSPDAQAVRIRASEGHHDDQYVAWRCPASANGCENGAARRAVADCGARGALTSSAKSWKLLCRMTRFGNATERNVSWFGSISPGSMTKVD